MKHRSHTIDKHKNEPFAIEICLRTTNYAATLQLSLSPFTIDWRWQHISQGLKGPPTGVEVGREDREGCDAKSRSRKPRPVADLGMWVEPKQIYLHKCDVARLKDSGLLYWQVAEIFFDLSKRFLIEYIIITGCIWTYNDIDQGWDCNDVLFVSNMTVVFKVKRQFSHDGTRNLI